MRPIMPIAVVLVFGGLARPCLAGSNLILDGGFETPAAPLTGLDKYNPGAAFGPWLVVGSGNITAQGTEYTSRGVLFEALSGKTYIDLTGLCDCGAASGIAQTVTTIPGTTYTLSFWVGNTVIPGVGTTSTTNVYVNSSLLMTAENTRGAGVAKQVWQNFTKSFVASGTSTQIAFYNGDPSSDINNGLDDVSLVAASNGAGFSTLYTFTSAAGGSTPNGGLALASSGLLYGSTYGGGLDNAGTLFSFNPTNAALTTLYSFTGKTDGSNPVDKLTIASNGIVYGATQYGGTGKSGTVYKFTPSSDQLATLYSFTGGTDGGNPGGGLLIDSAGNLVGNALAGGAVNFGDVFQIDPSALSEKTIYSFSGGGNGSQPGALAFNKAHLIVGATHKGGGTSDSGILYTLNEANGAKVTQYKFTGGDGGSSPTGGAAFDSAGNLYGTTLTGGTGNEGTLFKFNPVTKQLTTLYNFTGSDDGGGPFGSLIIDANGVLYGTTAHTGTTPETGTLYSFDPASNVFSVLHSFTGGADGGRPNPALVFDQAGEIVGTTHVGGTNGFGTIFKYIP